MLLPAAAPTLLFALLIVKEPDLGTAIACIAISAAVLFVAGMNMRYSGYALAASVLPLYFLIVRVAWRWAAMQAFLDPFKDPQGKGFHIIQSMIAVGTGGLTGLGLMEGKQKLFYLPEPHTDFIFAVIAEELGLVGIAAGSALVQHLPVSRRCAPRCAPKTCSARFWPPASRRWSWCRRSSTSAWCWRMMPAKGIPLPFISYGGSSLFITLASVGVLLNITQQAD